MSSWLAPIRVANVWRKLRATEKKDRSSTLCVRLFAATDACTALSATRGIAACAAKFKYVASSIGSHSFFQSMGCFRVIRRYWSRSESRPPAYPPFLPLLQKCRQGHHNGGRSHKRGTNLNG